MESIAGRHTVARINADYRDYRRKVAKMSSKKSHSANVMERGFFAHFFSAISAFFRGFFRRWIRAGKICARNYAYDGHIHTKGENGQQYGVYMRERGRKYKMAAQT